MADENGCHLTTYSLQSKGYGQIGYSEDGVKVNLSTHRAAWEFHHGPIPDGLTIDHICRQRNCVNVEHLQLMTLSENSGNRDYGYDPEVCRNGHPREGNTIKDGQRSRGRCRTCNVLRLRARRAA